MKRIYRSILLLAAALPAAFPAEAREIIDINRNWRFTLDDDRTYGEPAFDDSGWQRLDLPHDWSIAGAYDKRNPSGPQGGFMPCGTGWYRHSFEAPAGSEGNRVFVRFDGVYMKSQVWINGRMVGEYPNGYNSFEYDITPFVRRDTLNVLAVRVDNSLQPGSRWYTGSGIYRNVHLIVTSQMHFTDGGVFITTPEVSAERARIEINYHVINHNYPETRFTWTDNKSLYVWLRDGNADAAPKTDANNRVQKECTLTSILYDADGQEIKRVSTKHRIGDYSEADLRQQIEIDRPHLWSDQTPYLYKLVGTISYDGREADRVSYPVGVRTIRFSPERGMEVNGRQVKLQGVCLHQNVGCFGSAVPLGVWQERLETLKAMGCNAVRLSHYPFAPEFYDLCDSLGFYVSNEIFDEWNRGQEWGYSESSYGKMPYTYHLYFDQWGETDLRRMIRRDRNHPCVALYVLGNEIPNQRIQGIEIAQKLKAITREEDPARPVTAACDFFVGANIYGFMDQFDIAGYNYIDRIHPDSLYAAEHARYPNRILLGTETYHKTRNHVSIRDNASAIGEFVWVGYDYLGEIVWPDYRGWDEGMLDIAGFPKPEYYLRKSYWSDEPVVHIGVRQGPDRDFDWSPRNVADHWNWQGRDQDTLEVYAYSNCDEVELRIGRRSLGRKPVGRNDYYALWNVPFKAGTISATGYRQGKKVAEHRLLTAGKPYAVEVSRIFRYDDVIRVELCVVDKEGIRIPDSEAEITSGNIPSERLLGFDNGNQYDPQGLKYASAERGRCSGGRMVVYLKPDSTAVKATFDSPGLISAEAEI